MNRGKKLRHRERSVAIRIAAAFGLATTDEGSGVSSESPTYARSATSAARVGSGTVALTV